jgi:hypothetical protein
MGWPASNATLPRWEGGSLGIVRVCAHPVFDIVVDYEVEFFVAEAKMRSQQSVDAINERF